MEQNKIGNENIFLNLEKKKKMIKLIILKLKIKIIVQIF